VTNLQILCETAFLTKSCIAAAVCRGEYIILACMINTRDKKISNGRYFWKRY